MYYSNERHCVDYALEQRGRDLRGRRRCCRVEFVQITNRLEPYAMKQLGYYWSAKREINSDERASVRSAESSPYSTWHFLIMMADGN